ncbi:hypothetical protein KUCAC02_002983, partial [Chaenocephalus aceratus]
ARKTEPCLPPGLSVQSRLPQTGSAGNPAANSLISSNCHITTKPTSKRLGLPANMAETWTTNILLPRVRLLQSDGRALPFSRASLRLTLCSALQQDFEVTCLEKDLTPFNKIGSPTIMPCTANFKQTHIPAKIDGERQLDECFNQDSPADTF